MAIDASIPLQVRPVELPDQVAQYGKLLQLKGLQGQQQLQQLQLDSAKQDADENSRLKKLFGSIKPGADGSYDLQSLAPQVMAISPKGGANAVKSFAELNKSQIEEHKAKIEGVVQQIDLGSKLLNGVNDQASYDQAKAAAQQYGVDTSQWNPTFNPAEVEMNRRRALGLKDQLAAQHQELTLEETTRNNKFNNQVAANNSNINQQNATRMEEQGQTANEIRKQELDIRAKSAKTAAGSPDQKADDEHEVNRILDLAEPLIDKATNSYAGAGVDQAARFVGASTKGAQAAAQLRALEGSLVSKMPKMSGPQSDKDVLLYKQMAGQIGDPTIPAEQKKAAMQAIREINSRYTGKQTATPASSSGVKFLGFE